MGISEWWYNFKKNWIRRRKIKKETYVKPQIIREEEELSFPTFKKDAPKKVNNQYCNLKSCRRRLNLANAHDCKYCEGWFCDKHRLPEDHQCKGNPHLPPGMRTPGSKTHTKF